MTPRRRPASAARDACLIQQTAEGPGDVAGLFRGGKDPTAPLNRNRTARAFEQGHHLPGAEEGKRAEKKPRIARHLGQKLLQGAVIGQVAAAFSGDIHFFAELFVMLQKGDGGAGAGGKERRHHTGSAAADDEYMSHVPDSVISFLWFSLLRVWRIIAAGTAEAPNND